MPAIVDIPTRQVVTNDFARLTFDLSTEWRRHHRPGAPDLYPEARRDEIDDVNERHLRRRQQRRLPLRLRRVAAAPTSGRSSGCSPVSTGCRTDCANQRYLVGDTITEADVRLFTTLARFDAVYHGHFKCNRHKLSELPVLWAYARDLFQTPGFGDTIDFDHIKRHYYVVHHDINPTGIVPVGPALDGWWLPHDRERPRRASLRRRHAAGPADAGGAGAGDRRGVSQQPARR